jgi:hypothetical protein
MAYKSCVYNMHVFWLYDVRVLSAPAEPGGSRGHGPPSTVIF